MTTPNHYIVEIEQMAIDNLTEALVAATEAADDAQNAEIAAEIASREADELADRAHAAQDCAEQNRAEANSLTVNATIALCAGIVALVNNATPAHLNTFYIGEVIKRITARANFESNRRDAPDEQSDRWIERVADLITNRNYNPNA